MAAWIDPDDDNSATLLSEFWPDSSRLSAVTLTNALAVAQGQVVAYMPGEDVYPDDDGNVPPNLVQACILQARANWEAVKREGGDQDYPITPRPMDRTIQLLIRPKRAVRTVL